MADNKEDCCQKGQRKESKGFLSGIFYGLIPHTGCIAFIVFTVLGVTTATAFLKPLLLSPFFFYLLIGLSFVFATISAVIYLKKGDLLSLDGIKKKRGYLSVLYGSSIGINLLLFMVIFPIVANMTSGTPTSSFSSVGLSEITLKVDIPCPGHAPLINDELKGIEGVKSVKFRFPNYFDVNYDPAKTSQKEILSLKVFDAYPATKITGDIDIEKENNIPSGCSKCGGCSGACGGLCSV